MSEISSTISPISCDDSPSRLIRLAVSWICSRISFMPAIWLYTARCPRSAASSELRATLADSPALREASLICAAIFSTFSPVFLISRDCCSEADSSRVAMSRAAVEAVLTCSAVLLMRPTRPRSSSTV